MANDLFNKYIWLVDTIYRSGKITFKDINKRWLRSSLSGGEDLPLKTFHNWRREIEQNRGKRREKDGLHGGRASENAPYESDYPLSLEQRRNPHGETAERKNQQPARRAQPVEGKVERNRRNASAQPARRLRVHNALALPHVYHLRHGVVAPL